MRATATACQSTLAAVGRMWGCPSSPGPPCPAAGRGRRAAALVVRARGESAPELYDADEPGSAGLPEVPDSPSGEAEPLVEVDASLIHNLDVYQRSSFPHVAPGAYLRQEVALRLAAAAALPEPWGLAVFDAWRDPGLQSFLYHRAYDEPGLPPGFVSPPSPDPRTPPPHATGGTVDLTLSFEGRRWRWGRTSTSSPWMPSPRRWRVRPARRAICAGCSTARWPRRVRRARPRVVALRVRHPAVGPPSPGARRCTPPLVVRAEQQRSPAPGQPPGAPAPEGFADQADEGQDAGRLQERVRQRPLARPHRDQQPPTVAAA